MSGSVTPFKRVMAAINLSQVDRVPVVPQITYATSQFLGVKFHKPMFDSVLMARALWAGYERLGYDGIFVGWESSFNLIAESMGCELRIFEDQNPSVVKGVINRPQDLKEVKLPDPEKDGRLPVYLKAIDILKSKARGDVPLISYVPGPLTLSGVLYGLEKLMFDIIKNPGFVHRLSRFTTSASQEFAVAKAIHGADIVVVADPTASTDLISPAMFEDLAFPYIKEVIRAIDEAGAVPSLHICGNTSPILEKMVDTGAKVLELDEKVDLGEAKKRVGMRICLMGNVDTTLLLRGRPADVELKAKDCIDKAASGSGFILSSGCEIPLKTPIDNLRSMVQAAKKYGGYHDYETETGIQRSVL